MDRWMERYTVQLVSKDHPRENGKLEFVHRVCLSDCANLKRIGFPDIYRAVPLVYNATGYSLNMVLDIRQSCHCSQMVIFPVNCKNVSS